MSDDLRRYSKPSLTEDQLIDLWESRGLTISDRQRAKRYLRHIGYYRLSAYARSFEGPTRDDFRNGTTFDDVLALYVFDRKLRLLMLDAIERVEVALRAALIDEMSRLAGPHWYENAAHFKRGDAHQKLLNDVDKLLRLQQGRRPEGPLRSDQFVSALEYYMDKFDEPVRPPTWIVFEELSLGSTRAVYDGLRDSAVQARIAHSLGVEHAVVLASWLKSYQRVRNIAAHHGRLWNRGLGVYPMIPRSRSIRWLDTPTAITDDRWRLQRLYPVLVSLQTILHTISPGSSWSTRMRGLLEANPDVLAGMGVPANWYEDSFWPKR